jgi:hypothetical protein
MNGELYRETTRPKLLWKTGISRLKVRKDMNRVHASYATKRKNRATYCNVKEQRSGKKKMWTRDFRILMQ